MSEHVRINAVVPRIQYVADGVQTAFTFPFAIFKDADLEVWLGDAVQAAGFTVAGSGQTGGGTATFLHAPAAGTRVTLRRRVKIERTTDLQADGIIRAKTLNDELDFQVAAAQQLAEDVGRAVLRSPASTSSADLTLPEPQAGALLGWSADGTRLANRTLADAASTVAFGGAGLAVAEADLPGDARAALQLGSAATCAAEDFVSAQDAEARLAFLERNLALNTLRDQIDAGWSVLRMVDGIADEFEDEAGVDGSASAGATYDAAGDFYHNPGIGHGPDLVTGAETYAASHTPLSGSVSSPADGGTGTGCTFPTATSAWWRVTFATAKAVTKLRYYAGAATSLQGVYLEGSNDGTAWTVLDTSTFSSSAWIERVFNNATAYLHYRLRVAYSSANSWGLYEVELFESAAPSDMSLISVSHTAEALPSEARLLLLHQPLATVTPNADVVAEVSRDGGVTWSVATLSDEGSFDGTTDILAGTADLSAQPAGTAMRWRVRTLNNKSQRLHGVWLQWR